MASSGSPTFPSQSAFTLLELLAVIAIITLLVGLIVGTSTYAKRKSKEAKATSQLKQLVLALELYKTEQGAYPSSLYNWPQTNKIAHAFDTGVDLSGSTVTVTWATTNAWVLYRALTGYSITNGPPAAPDAGPSYFHELKEDQIRTMGGYRHLVDPYGDAWGYFKAPSGSSWKTNQFNSHTYDLWTFGLKVNDPTNSLIANWRQL